MFQLFYIAIIYWHSLEDNQSILIKKVDLSTTCSFENQYFSKRFTQGAVSRTSLNYFTLSTFRHLFHCIIFQILAFD